MDFLGEGWRDGGCDACFLEGKGDDKRMTGGDALLTNMLWLFDSFRW